MCTFYQTSPNQTLYHNSLILYLGKECVEAVYFLFLLHVSVVLGDTEEGEFVHQVDFVGFGQVPLLERGC